MDKDREIERININLREARKIIKIHIDKFGKEIASDYQIKVPKEIIDYTKEEFDNWILSIKDKVLKVEDKLEVKSFFVVILSTYLNSLEQLKRVENKAELSK